MKNTVNKSHMDTEKSCNRLRRLYIRCQIGEYALYFFLYKRRTGIAQ